MGLPRRLRIWFFRTYLDPFTLHCVQRAYSSVCKMFYREGDEKHFVDAVIHDYMFCLNEARMFLIGRRLNLNIMDTLPLKHIGYDLYDEICRYCYAWCTKRSSCRYRYFQIEGKYIKSKKITYFPICDACHEYIDWVQYYSKTNRCITIYGRLFRYHCAGRKND